MKVDVHFAYVFNASLSKEKINADFDGIFSNLPQMPLILK